MSNPTLAPTLLNPFFGQDVPIDGGAQSQMIVLTGILIELRTQTEYLRAIAQGQIINDDPQQLRNDQYIDPQFIKVA